MSLKSYICKYSELHCICKGKVFFKLKHFVANILFSSLKWKTDSICKLKWLRYHVKVSLNNMQAITKSNVSKFYSSFKYYIPTSEFLVDTANLSCMLLIHWLCDKMSALQEMSSHAESGIDTDGEGCSQGEIMKHSFNW